MVPIYWTTWFHISKDDNTDIYTTINSQDKATARLSYQIPPSQHKIERSNSTWYPDLPIQTSQASNSSERHFKIQFLLQNKRAVCIIKTNLLISLFVTYQTCNLLWMRFSPFWAVTQCVLVINYQCTVFDTWRWGQAVLKRWKTTDIWRITMQKSEDIINTVYCQKHVKRMCTHHVGKWSLPVLIQAAKYNNSCFKE